MEPNRFKLARTKYNQHGHQSVKEVAAATGITRSLIDDLEANVDKTKRGVSYMKVATLAKHYGVSTDYLCGLAGVETPNKDLREICEYVGLSTASVTALNQISHSPYDYPIGTTAKGYTWPSIEIIDTLISSKGLLRLTSELAFYLIYGEALPKDAYTEAEDDLSVAEYDKFHAWANGRGFEIVQRRDVCNMHLQNACDVLKGIFQEILRQEIAEETEGQNAAQKQ